MILNARERLAYDGDDHDDDHDDDDDASRVDTAANTTTTTTSTFATAACDTTNSTQTTMKTYSSLSLSLYSTLPRPASRRRPSPTVDWLTHRRSCMLYSPVVLS